MGDKFKLYVDIRGAGQKNLIGFRSNISVVLPLLQQQIFWPQVHKQGLHTQEPQSKARLGQTSNLDESVHKLLEANVEDGPRVPGDKIQEG